MLRRPRHEMRWVRLVTSVSIIAAVTTIAACGESEHEARKPDDVTSTGPPTAAQLAEARRLINPENSPQAPTADEVACVARVVVQDPVVDEVANDMAQISNKDLRELVMT